MLLTKTVRIKWGSKNKKYYISKGYTFTKFGDEFKVKIKDLTKGNKSNIEVQCDNCEKILRIHWCDYRKHVKKDGRYYCIKCTHNLYSNELGRLTKLKNGISFRQWCIENNQQDALNRWDYELNKCSPNEVSYRSKGFNNKGYFFKCLKNSHHKSELKSISDFVNGCKGSIVCNQCKSIGQWLLDYYGDKGIKLYWSDINTISPFQFNYGSTKKVWFKCPICNNKKYMSINQFTNNGLACNQCSDGISFPNKIGMALLKQIQINFITEYSPDWIKPKRYDFYFKLNDKKYVIEMDGRFHNEDNSLSGQTAIESKFIDNYKDKLAKEHNIKVIRVDCQISDIDYIKNNILNSELVKLFNLSKIDWDKCEEYACKSLIKETCNLWNNNNSIDVISDKVLIGTQTIRKYLKQGAKLGWCNYNPKDEIKKHNAEISKKVYCFELNEVFSSAMEIQRKLQISQTCISNNCLGKQKSAGKHPTTGEKLHWIFYEDYLNLQK